MTTKLKFENIAEDFEYLEDWDDRYKYLIELGHGLVPLTPSEHNANTKVHGCASQTWIVWDREKGPDPVVNFRGDSDAHIVRGLVAVALSIFSGKRASEILAIDERKDFERLRLSEHITPQRSNGLRAMVRRVKEIAAAAL